MTETSLQLKIVFLKVKQLKKKQQKTKPLTSANQVFSLKHLLNNNVHFWTGLFKPDKGVASLPEKAIN